MHVGGAVVPLADVHEARALSSAEAARWRRVAARRGRARRHGTVLVRAVTPEGLATIWLVGARDPAAFAAEVAARARSTTRAGPALSCERDATLVTARVVRGAEIGYVRSAWRRHRTTWRDATWPATWAAAGVARRRAIVATTAAGELRVTRVRRLGAAWTELVLGRRHGS
ncbi:MAG TPA: hypothetical protein VHJ34_04320 [Actinomycetota bacterium]|nr:hypothetical protein [Actinomycetota bacterium]